jgi:prepilin-type N-terminal cleavage/methylation domain-containing protein
MGVRAEAYSRSRRGFTLIEVAIVTVIIGLGVVGLLELMVAGSMSNASASRRATAVHLANGIHEMCYQKTWPQLLALNGTTFDPAVDARGDVALENEGWSQQIAVQPVQVNRLTQVATANSPMVRVTVRVSRFGEQVYETRWLMARTHPVQP